MEFFIYSAMAFILYYIGWKLYQKYQALVRKANKGELLALVRQTEEKINKEKNAERIRIHLLQMEQFIGKPVICLSNAYEQPMIGIYKEIQFTGVNNDCPVAVVTSYSGDNLEEFIVMGHIFYFTWQRFSALMKLDPNERVALIFNSYNSQVELDMEKKKPLVIEEQILFNLQKNGFFKETGIVPQGDYGGY